MTALDSALTLKLTRLQARDQVLTHAASHLLTEHARLAAPHACWCPLCRALHDLGIAPKQAIPMPVHRSWRPERIT